MSIHELLKHEKGMLNLYEQQLLKHRHTFSNMNKGKESVFGVKLSSYEYDSIFDSPPTFYEKRAFVDLFRKKWKEDRGFCSLFEKRPIYKQAVQEYLVGLQKKVKQKRPMSTGAKI